MRGRIQPRRAALSSRVRAHSGTRGLIFCPTCDANGNRLGGEYAAADEKSVFVYAGATAPAYMIRGDVTYRIVTDNQGSVRLVVNTETGEIAQRLDYDSFGRVLRDTNPGFQPFGFQGGLYDPDTGLVEFGCRWYDAATGRWISKDPIGMEGGLNLYEFCGGNPITYTDPSGLTIVWDLKPFPGSRQLNYIPGFDDNRYYRWISDGREGIVRLQRFGAGRLDDEMRDLAQMLHGYDNEGGGRSFWKDIEREKTFDSSFFQVTPDQQREYYYFEGHDGVWADNEVNYIAIGMYEAWLKHSLQRAKTMTALWKLKYRTKPSVGTVYWLSYGHRMFHSYYGSK